jgi:hypothetical protein
VDESDVTVIDLDRLSLSDPAKDTDPDASAWMPWNYRQTLAQVDASLSICERGSAVIII